MRAWAARIAPLLRDQGRTVVAAFNNTDEDKPPSAVLDAMALGRELRALGLMDA
jgi:Mrp family chromosome partitioning ATPase